MKTDEDQKTSGETPSKEHLSFRDQLLEFVRVFIIAVALILPVRLFLIQPFYVHGQSMEPNFHDTDYLIIDKITPHIYPLKRGEIVVFLHKDPRFGPKARYLIKRVIGLPGERVRIADGAVIIYNDSTPQGFALHEGRYNPESMNGLVSDVTLSAGEYYVLGDNRPVSEDSENFGPVQNSQIVGRVWVRGFPFNRFKVFEAPSY